MTTDDCRRRPCYWRLSILARASTYEAVCRRLVLISVIKCVNHVQGTRGLWDAAASDGAGWRADPFKATRTYLEINQKLERLRVNDVDKTANDQSVSRIKLNVRFAGHFSFKILETRRHRRNDRSPLLRSFPTQSPAHGSLSQIYKKNVDVIRWLESSSVQGQSEKRIDFSVWNSHFVSNIFK